MGPAALPLRSPRLVLDRLTAADAGEFSRIVRLPEVGRMLFVFGPDFSEAEAEALISRQADPTTRPLRLAIRRADTPALIGTIGVGAGEAPDIYYFLDPAQAGLGLMREALATFLPFVAAQFGPRALGAKVFTDNPASAHLLSTLGFACVGEGMVQSAQRDAPAPVWLFRREGAALPDPPEVFSAR